MYGRTVLFALLALSAAPVRAQTLDRADRRINLAGTAPAACVIAQPSPSRTLRATYSAAGTGSGQITINQLVDSQTATSLESAVQLELPVTCNSAHQVSVRSANGAMVRTGGAASPAPSAAFSEALDYQLAVDWNGNVNSISSNQGPILMESTQPAKGYLLLNFSTSAGKGPFVAGQYTDAIIVEFIPSN